MKEWEVPEEATKKIRKTVDMVTEISMNKIEKNVVNPFIVLLKDEPVKALETYVLKPFHAMISKVLGTYEKENDSEKSNISKLSISFKSEMSTKTALVDNLDERDQLG